MNLSEVEREVVRAVDLDGLVRLLCELVEIPSVDGRETEAQRRMADAMDAAGLEVDLWSIDFAELRHHPEYSAEIERSEGLGLVGCHGRSGSGRDLLFNGHIDVVPPGNLADWSTPPWQGTVTEGRVQGRGALDMKGGLCCALFAVRAIRDVGVDLGGRLIVESVIGEEDGGCGTLASSLRGYRADGAVIPEPTRLAIAPAQAGCCNFRLTVRGLSAHGCVREEGVSALERFWPLHRALLEFEQRYNEDHRDPLFADYRLPWPLSIGVVHAGDWPSSVPDTLVCEGRFGVAVDQEPEEARGELEAAVGRAVEDDPWLRRHPPTLEWWGGQFAPARTDPEHPLVRTLADSFQSLSGRAPVFQGMTYGADMRLLQRVADTPTVMFGPGDIRRAHRPDEWVSIDELRTVAETLALTALRFCPAPDRSIQNRSAESPTARGPAP